MEICSFIRVLITVLKCLKPNSFTTAVSFYFLQNYIFFAIYISLWDTMVQLSHGTQCRQFRSPNCKLRCFLSSCGPPTVVAEIVWSSIKPPCSTSSHIPSPWETGMDEPLWLMTLSPSFQCSQHILFCDVWPFGFNLCAPPDYKPQHHFSSPLDFSTHPLSIYNCLSLTWKASPPSSLGRLPMSLRGCWPCPLDSSWVLTLWLREKLKASFKKYC